jgi:uncharacterized protein (DUF1501 family)
MRRHLLDLVVLFVLASLVCGYVSLAQPSLRNVTLHVYVFLVGGLLMLGLVAAAGDAVPKRLRSELDVALGESTRRNRRLPEVERIEREVTLATASAYDLHFRLLPHLREIAQCRLERAGKTPGPETLGRWWELLRPDRPEPDDRFAPGIKEAELRALVADLERM